MRIPSIQGTVRKIVEVTYVGACGVHLVAESVIGEVRLHANSLYIRTWL